MKLMVWVGVLAGGALGGLVGAIIDRGNWVSVWSILLSTVGSLIGVWAGYTVARRYF